MKLRQSNETAAVALGFVRWNKYKYLVSVVPADKRDSMDKLQSDKQWPLWQRFAARSRWRNHSFVVTRQFDTAVSVRSTRGSVQVSLGQWRYCIAKYPRVRVARTSFYCPPHQHSNAKCNGRTAWLQSGWGQNNIFYRIGRCEVASLVINSLYS